MDAISDMFTQKTFRRDLVSIIKFGSFYLAFMLGYGIYNYITFHTALSTSSWNKNDMLDFFEAINVGYWVSNLSLVYIMSSFVYAIIKYRRCKQNEDLILLTENHIKGTRTNHLKHVIKGNGNTNASTTSQLTLFTREILGKGSGGTIVYKRKICKRDVAIKKVTPFQYHNEAENEIDFLIKCNGHPNIVQYFISVKLVDGYYSALELCNGKTLKDWVNNQHVLPVLIDGLDILSQVCKGLEFLHKTGIIHRDLKPSNILFSIVGEIVFVKLSDFGISRLLEPGINSKTLTSFGGTRGWTAAEMILAEKSCLEKGTWNTEEIPKLTKKLDMFSLGCIFYYVLTNGKHPFGDDEDLLDYNIKRNLVQFKSDHLCLRLRCNLPLIEKMIAFDPNDRPITEEIQTHPILWSNQKMINFLVELSNYIFDATPTTVVRNCVFNLEAKYLPVISQGQREGWFIGFSRRIRTILEERYNNHRTSVKKLIRLIRNLNNHYDEPRNLEIKQLIGDKPNAFMNFWLEKFPMLINETREAFQDLKGESNLEQFYI